MELSLDGARQNALRFERIFPFADAVRETLASDIRDIPQIILAAQAVQYEDIDKEIAVLNRVSENPAATSPGAREALALCRPLNCPQWELGVAE